MDGMFVNKYTYLGKSRKLMFMDIKRISRIVLLYKECIPTGYRCLYILENDYVHGCYLLIRISCFVIFLSAIRSFASFKFFVRSE